MSDAEAKLKVSIETTATGQGVQQTAAGVEQVANAAQKAAPAMGQLGTQSGKTAAELGRGVEVGNAASTMVQNLAASTKGGATGFLSLARGAFGAGVALKGVLASMGPFGAIAAGIGIALGLITAALQKSDAAAKSTQEKLEKLNQQKLDNAVKQQKALEDAADLALKKIDAEYNALERIADAELNRLKSGVDADVAGGKLTKEEGDRRKLALDRQREDEKRTTLLGAEEAKARTLEDLAAKTSDQAQAENAEYERQKKLLADVAAAKKTLAEATPDYESTIPGYEQAYGKAGKLADAEKAAAGTSQQMVDDQKKRADEQKASAEQAQKAAAAARLDADIEKKVQRIETPLIKQTRANEDKAKQPQTDAEKTAQEAAQAKYKAQAGYLTADQWRARITNGEKLDPGLIEAIQKTYPKAKIAAPKSPEIPFAPPSLDAAQPEAPKPKVQQPKVPADYSIQLGDAASPLPTPALSPKAVMQRGGGQLPSDLARTGLPGGITAGPGSDSKLADQTKELNKTMQKTGEQAEKKVDLQPAVDGAKKVQEGQEQLKSAFADATAAQADAMQATRETTDEITSTLSSHASAIRSIRSEIVAIKAQARAARVA